MKVMCQSSCVFVVFLGNYVQGDGDVQWYVLYFCFVFCVIYYLRGVLKFVFVIKDRKLLVDSDREDLEILYKSVYNGCGYGFEVNL